jgi:hypothetical protein
VRSRSLALAAEALVVASGAAAYLVLGAAVVLFSVWWELYRDLRTFGLDLWPHLLEDIPSSGAIVAPQVILVLLGVTLWWRGSSLAWGGIPVGSLLQQFVWGAGVVLALAALGSTASLDAATVALLMGGYLAFGVTALSSSRLDLAAAGRAPPRMRSLLAALVFLLLLCGFALAVWLMPALGEPVRAVWGWMTGVAVPAVVAVLRWIAQLLGLDRPPEPLPLEPLVGSSEPPGARGFFTLPEPIRDTGRLLFNLSWVILLLYAFCSSFWRLLARLRVQGEEAATRERLPWSVRLGIRQAFFTLVYGVVRRWPSLRTLFGKGTWGDGPGTAREVYRWLLAWGASRGVQRKPWMTPRELKEVFSAGWPHLAGDFDLLTESYLRARYGGPPISAGDLAAALAGWRRIARDRTRRVRADSSSPTLP